MDKKILLDDFKNALTRFAEAVGTEHAIDLEKAGCIQFFEFCFELAWKSIKAVAEDLGLTDCQSPRAALKCAFGQGWLSDESLWLDMLSSRNRMAHTYEAGEALRIYSRLASYAPAFRELYEKLSAVP